jgi:hypothetical protein
MQVPHVLILRPNSQKCKLDEGAEDKPTGFTPVRVRITERLTLVLRIRNHPKPFPRPSHANSTTPFDAVVQTKPHGAGSRHNNPSWAVAVSRLGIRVLRLIFVGQSRLGTESRARRHTATFVGTWRGPEPNV